MKLGLALAGGGVRGAAHIGVIKALEENGIKVFSERKVTSLLKVEETILDKMKNKLASIFTKKIFAKKKYLPNIELIYESNPNRFKDFKTSSKLEAKNRMKALLNKEREVTRSANN